METDLLEAMMATTNGTLKDADIRFSDGAACCVVMASGGYPGSYQTGFEMTVPADLPGQVYIAGAKCGDGKLYTAGGRVLGAVATADNLTDAVLKAYGLVADIHFENAYFRHDIGKRALEAGKE